MYKRIRSNFLKYFYKEYSGKEHPANTNIFYKTRHFASKDLSLSMCCNLIKAFVYNKKQVALLIQGLLFQSVILDFLDFV